MTLPATPLTPLYAMIAPAVSTAPAHDHVYVKPAVSAAVATR